MLRVVSPQPPSARRPPDREEVVRLKVDCAVSYGRVVPRRFGCKSGGTGCTSELLRSIRRS